MRHLILEKYYTEDPKKMFRSFLTILDGPKQFWKILQPNRMFFDKQDGTLSNVISYDPLCEHFYMKNDKIWQAFKKNNIEHNLAIKIMITILKEYYKLN